MRVLIIGGRGAAGSRVAAEAERRGHDVTVASRSASDRTSGRTLRLDASDTEAVTAAAREADVVIGTTRPAVGREADVEDVTTSLITAAGRAQVQLVVIGGAAPLRVPGTDRLALDDAAFVPPAIRPIAQASVRQLDLLREGDQHAAWVYLAPAANFGPGEARGRYRTCVGDRHGAELVVAEDGTSSISMEDFALAVCDEIERDFPRVGVVSVGWGRTRTKGVTPPSRWQPPPHR